MLRALERCLSYGCSLCTGSALEGNYIKCIAVGHERQGEEGFRVERYGLKVEVAGFKHQVPGLWILNSGSLNSNSLILNCCYWIQQFLALPDTTLAIAVMVLRLRVVTVAPKRRSI